MFYTQIWAPLYMAIGYWKPFRLGRLNSKSSSKRRNAKPEISRAPGDFLVGGAFIRADEQTALHLWICQQHDLKHRQEVFSLYSSFTVPQRPNTSASGRDELHL